MEWVIGKESWLLWWWIWDDGWLKRDEMSHSLDSWTGAVRVNVVNATVLSWEHKISGTDITTWAILKWTSQDCLRQYQVEYQEYSPTGRQHTMWQVLQSALDGIDGWKQGKDTKDAHDAGVCRCTVGKNKQRMSGGYGMVTSENLFLWWEEHNSTMSSLD